MESSSFSLSIKANALSKHGYSPDITFVASLSINSLGRDENSLMAGSLDNGMLKIRAS